MRIKRVTSAILFVALFLPAISMAQKVLTFDDHTDPAVYPAQIKNLQWIPGTQKFSFIEENNLVVRQAGAKEGQVVMTLEQLNTSLEEGGLGKVRRFIEVKWLTEETIRMKYGSTIISINIKNSKVTVEAEMPKETDNAVFDHTGLRFAYTADDNVFIRGKDLDIQVTADGGDGIVNGKTVHRNEFGIDNGLFWSSDGTSLAFYRKDETMVTQYPLVNTDARIAEVEFVRYPMAGMTSEEVQVGVYNIQTGTTTFLKTGEPADQFLTNVTWAPDGKSIYIAVLNRGQNHMKLNRYNAISGDFELTLFEEQSDFYVEPQHGPLFLPNNPNQFIWQSQQNGWNHLYLYDTNGKLIKRYTSGDWVVTEVDGFDASGNNLFFYSTEKSPLEQHYFQLDLKKGKIVPISSSTGMHNVMKSDDAKFFIDRYSNNEGVANCIELLNQKGKKIEELLENKDPLEDFQKAEIKIGTLTADDGTVLYYRMILPPDFDPNKKYPVFYYLYGGPHNQLITNSWLGGAGLFLTTMAHKGYIVFSLDNRGSANRGFYFESAIHRKLGKLESEDQMKGVEYLKSLPYVDTARMGIHGWSYGGFMTITMMQRYPGAFKTGVAGGPVTDWKYYEIMYGERYMDTPDENPMGYKESSLLTSLPNLEGRLLIIHGTMDDVVVWQHSQAYVKESVAQKKLVDYYIYPGHKHNVRGVDRLHLFKKIEQYIDDYL